MQPYRVQEVITELERFGTPDEVADYFRSRGIKGIRGRSTECPLANFIKSETGLVRVGVGWQLISIGVEKSIYVTPETLRFFARSFDEGLYSDLESIE